VIKTRDWRKDPPAPKIEVCPFGPNRGPRREDCSTGGVSYQRLYSTFERCRPSPTSKVIPSRTAEFRSPGNRLSGLLSAMAVLGIASNDLFFVDDYDPFKR
jgi:hypothetical protein